LSFSTWKLFPYHLWSPSDIFLWKWSKLKLLIVSFVVFVIRFNENFSQNIKWVCSLYVNCAMSHEMNLEKLLSVHSTLLLLHSKGLSNVGHYLFLFYIFNPSLSYKELDLCFNHWDWHTKRKKDPFQIQSCSQVWNKCRTISFIIFTFETNFSKSDIL
jgi:hypothetical protein